MELHSPRLSKIHSELIIPEPSSTLKPPSDTNFDEQSTNLEENKKLDFIPPRKRSRIYPEQIPIDLTTSIEIIRPCPEKFRSLTPSITQNFFQFILNFLISIVFYIAQISNLIFVKLKEDAKPEIDSRIKSNSPFKSKSPRIWVKIIIYCTIISIVLCISLPIVFLKRNDSHGTGISGSDQNSSIHINKTKAYGVPHGEVFSDEDRVGPGYKLSKIYFHQRYSIYSIQVQVIDPNGNVINHPQYGGSFDNLSVYKPSMPLVKIDIYHNETLYGLEFTEDDGNKYLFGMRKGIKDSIDVKEQIIGVHGYAGDVVNRLGFITAP